jgi:hypothetical protein
LHFLSVLNNVLLGISEEKHALEMAAINLINAADRKGPAGIYHLHTCMNIVKDTLKKGNQDDADKRN